MKNASSGPASGRPIGGGRHAVMVMVEPRRLCSSAAPPARCGGPLRTLLHLDGLAAGEGQVRRLPLRRPGRWAPASIPRHTSGHRSSSRVRLERAGRARRRTRHAPSMHVCGALHVGAPGGPPVSASRHCPGSRPQQLRLAGHEARLGGATITGVAADFGVQPVSL